MNEKLVAFHRGEGADDEGRRLADIWRYSDDELEAVHDYIQWLFPLTEPSAFNPSAPVLDAATIERMRSDETIRSNVERSLDVMLGFYGLARDGDRIVRGANFAERARNWLAGPNHNFLRLTRILKSLVLLGFGAEARALLACLEEVHDSHGPIIGNRTMAFWRRAVD